MTRACLVPLALTLAACGHARSSSSGAAAPASASAASPAGGPPGGGMAGLCPMAVPGTKLSTADTAAGEALTFTAGPDQAAALRERVHAMAEMHNHHHGSGEADHGGTTGTAGGAPGETGGMAMPPPSRASVEDLPDGARLTVTPNDPAELQRLQATVRMHAEHMREHGCEMMDHHGTMNH
jgi:hypothetical protein